MRQFLRITFAGALGFLTAGLVACGSSSPGLLSSDQAAQLNSRLSQIASSISSGNCPQAGGAAASFQNDVAQLPDSVSTTLRQDLIDGASTIAQLTPKTCTSQTTTTPTTTTATQTTTTTQTTAPPPPPTTTSAPPPTTSTAAQNSGNSASSSSSSANSGNGGGNGGVGLPSQTATSPASGGAGAGSSGNSP